MSANASHPPHRFWLSGKRHVEQDHFFRQALEAKGWSEGDEQHWHAAWVTGMPPKSAFRAASPHAKMNHIPGNAALTVKSRLHTSLSALRERTQRHFGSDHTLMARLNFFPRAYEMPHDYPALVEDAEANPTKRWILKPTNASKGKGIQVLSDLTAVPLSPNWLVQEYVANPHTIRGHKYVLRLYMLIASIDPLRVYLYDQGFAKLASDPWDPDDVDNPFSQLTNPDINALNVDTEIPVEFIDLERYRHWLREQGHNDNALFSQLRDLAALTALSGVDAMRMRSVESSADPQGCYELIGLDCIIDDQLNPWILECNLSPSLGVCAKPEHGGITEEAIKAKLVHDMINLIGLNQAVLEADVDAKALADEHQRAGDFVPLYPTPYSEQAKQTGHSRSDNYQDYLPFIGLPSLLDYRLASEETRNRVAFRANAVSELIEDDHLALYHHVSGLYYQLNDSAALIWLLVSSGETLDSILHHLQAASGGDATPAQLENDLWGTLAPWWQHGLLAPRCCDTPAPAPLSSPELSPVWHSQLAFNQRRWPITAPTGPAANRIVAALSPLLIATNTNPAGEPLHVLESANGYCLATDSHVVSSRLHIDELVPAITRFCLTHASQQGHLVLDITLLSSAEQHIVCLLPESPNSQALATLTAATEQHGLTLSRGARLAFSDPEILEPLNLPIAHAPFSPTQPQRCSAILQLNTTKTIGAAEAPNSLNLLGALLPFAQEQQHLSPSALHALREFCQQPPCTQLNISAPDAKQALNQWLSQLTHSTPSHAAS
ncbi:PqqD family peptide modification chaperone [Vreelandella zhaodongensis]|uniref:PqqD family peptide modification chaperone n=1 Tax=Vreelandella zhaodongensis TaxID=1176240 RepID=UPI003EBEBEAA